MSLLLKSPLVLNPNVNEGGIRIGNINIDSSSLYNLLYKVISITLILAFMYITFKIGSRIIDNFVERQGKMKFSMDDKKSRTLGALFKSLLRYSVYFFGIIAILTQLFNTVSLTFAGIGGVAIGLGAQSLIKDVISGFFILLENQFSVGEYISVENMDGIVESIELRLTKIRDFNGDLHIIPNGLITKVTNHSRGDKRITIELDIDNEEDVDRAIKAISSVCEEFEVGNEDVVARPKVVGITALKDNRVTIKIVGRVKPMTKLDYEIKLRGDIKKVLDKENIKIAYPKTKILRED